MKKAKKEVKEVETMTIPTAEINEVLQYLASKPYAEVYKLIDMIVKNN